MSDRDFMTEHAKAARYKLYFFEREGQQQANVIHRGHRIGTLLLCRDVTGHEYPVASTGSWEVSRLRETIRDAMMEAGMLEAV